MKEENEHFGEKINFYSRLNPKFLKTKDDVWEDIESRMEEPVLSEDVYKLPINIRYNYAIAAFAIILLGVGLFMRLYTVEFQTTKGMHSQVILPDGSTVNLNASSELSYHPYWWRFERDVEIKGEGFFKVKKGESFTVQSGKVKTTVLGTSFNVLYRNNKVEVSCVTGLVQVENDKNRVLLNPYDMVVSNESEQLIKAKFEDVKNITAWIDNEFYYKGVSFQKVLNDIQLQFNVDIAIDINVDSKKLIYSGYYKKDHSLEKVLNLVCKPFGLNYKKTNEEAYLLFYDD